MKIRFALRTIFIATAFVAVGLTAYLTWLDHLRFQEHAAHWREAEEIFAEDFEWQFEADDRVEILKWTSEDVLGVIKNEEDFDVLDRARFWCAPNRSRIIPELIGLLTDQGQPGLVNTADLIIFDRIQSGDLEFYGHGYVVDDDLFSVAGRASWILKDVTGYDAGSVHIESTSKDIEKLQHAWSTWANKYLRRLQEYRKPKGD